MSFYKKRTIASYLTQEQINFRIADSKKFDGKVSNEEFEIRENKSISNKFLFPIIKGTIEKYDDSTNVVISFNVSKQDKSGLGIFLFIVSLISVLLGIVSSDVLLTMIILCFEIVLCAVFLIYYAINCSRAYRKLYRMLNSKNLY